VPSSFHIQAETWDILGIEYLADYRHADLSSSSPDLAKIAFTLRALSALPPPAMFSSARWKTGSEIMATTCHFWQVCRSRTMTQMPTMFLSATPLSWPAGLGPSSLPHGSKLPA
jgi:hypothetical protein